jgi:hypothetical protein
MAISNWNAGIIRPIPVAPAGPYQDSAAPGVWTLDQVAYWQKQGLWPTAGNVAPTALFGGGNTGSNSSVIDYVSIATAGNATDFGDLTQTVSLLAGCSSSTRGLFGGGTTGVAYSNVIDYVTIGTLGNATDFGDLTVARGYVAALSNAIRGVWGGGDSGLRSSVIDYVTIASAGNATDFGDLILGLGTYMAGCASTTRGLFGGGNEGNVINIVVYITIASAGNAIDFGDLTVAREALAACSSAITGVFAGGKLAGTLYNVIDYVTIGTPHKQENPLSNDLIISSMNTALTVQKPEYNLMLKNIQDRLPAVQKDTSNFHKSHSQFMSVTLDVTAITPIRSIKHTLAEIDRTKSALQEAYIGLRKKQNELKKKERELASCTDDLDRELLEIEILELNSHLEGTQNHVNGALRKMNFMVNQHKQLLEKVGKDEITEEDYEREESRYHIMTCMKQA